MARFAGQVGFVKYDETAPGVYEEVIDERFFIGDVLRGQRNLRPDDNNIHGRLNVNNSISIIADNRAIEEMFSIRYVVWMGNRFIVTNVEIRYPRVILTIGGVYNGPSS
jgi:hypothetical protein|nr:MAG TPA: hypothetical protein [Caudoviricetes sp.]